MKANVYKSENGQLVAVSLGDHILVEFEERLCYMFTNPDKPGIFANQVRQIEYDIRETPQQIIEKARQAYEGNSDLVTP